MYLAPNITKRLFEKKKELDLHRPLPRPILKRLHEQFVVEWTYHSNAIEGNRLTLRETELVLNYGITIHGKSLREHFEATNHKTAILELEKFVGKRRPLTEPILLKLHSIILSNIMPEYAGTYRRENVRILGARLIPPSALKVAALMKNFFRWLRRDAKKLNIIVLAALAHYKLVEIHPFIDGNGRLARLMMNLLLMQHGFPPAVILRQDRKKYYDALDEANTGKLEPFVRFVAQAVERSLGLYLDAITPKVKRTDMKKEYLLLREIATHTPYSQEYLSLLARTGKIHAIKKNRNWYTTMEAIEKYLQELKANAS